MNIKGKEIKIDKAVLGKAVVLMLMSWAALPIIYFMLLRRKNEKTKRVPCEGGEDILPEG